MSNDLPRRFSGSQFTHTGKHDYNNESRVSTNVASKRTIRRLKKIKNRILDKFFDEQH